MSDQNDIKTNADSLVSQAATFQEEFEKFFEDENASSAARARKALLEVGKLSRTLRKQIQELKKTRKEASKAPAE